MPLPDGYTEDDLIGLSENEKKILMGDDDGDDGDDDLPGNDDTGTDGDDTGATDDAKPGDTPPADEPEDDGEQALQYPSATPKDAAEQRAALETEKNEAFTKLMAGELEPADYQKIEKRVSDALQELLTATITDSVTSTLTKAQVQQAWDGEIKRVVKMAKDSGLDYKDPDMGAEFDGMVRVYGGIAAQKGMTDDAGMKASKWALQQAHETMLKKYGKTPAPASKSRAGSTPDLSSLPPSLRGAPQAATATSGADEFAHIETLKGIDKEKALARLTPEQQDRYLA